MNKDQVKGTATNIVIISIPSRCMDAQTGQILVYLARPPLAYANDGGYE